MFEGHKNHICLFIILSSFSVIYYMLAENYFDNYMEIIKNLSAYQSIFLEEVIDESDSARTIQNNITDNNHTQLKSNNQQRPKITAKKKEKGNY